MQKGTSSLAKCNCKHKVHHSKFGPFCTIKEVVDEDVDVLDASAASTDLVIEPSRSVPGLVSGKRRRVLIPTLKEWVDIVNQLPKKVVVKHTFQVDPSRSVPGLVSGKRRRVLIPTLKEWVAMINEIPRVVNSSLQLPVYQPVKDSLSLEVEPSKCLRLP